MTDETPPPRLFVKNKYNNTVLNWHRAPQKEFHFYGGAFWNAAKKLLDNEDLDRRPIASFDACVVVYLYRHALELFLKGILIGGGGELIDPCPSPQKVVKARHSLTELLPHVRRVFTECGWDTFGSKAAVTFDDFTAIVEEFERTDPSSVSFRYPVKKKDLAAALDSHFTFSVRRFASIMDEVLDTLSGACDSLPDIANDRASYCIASHRAS
ncbi:MAG: hypothetical protein ABSH00_14955 [Bryobacteraceae bacterium]|jgi:hypothetical protein